MTGGRKRCPQCGKPVVVAFKPFCSARCADADLGRWLSEGYRVAGTESLREAGAGGDDDDD